MGKKTKAKLQCYAWESPRGRLEMVRAQGIDNSFPRHSHQSYCLGLVEKGGRLILRNGQATLIPEGGLFLIQPKQSHACRSPQADTHSYSVLCLPADFMAEQARRRGMPPSQPPVFSSIRLDDNRLANAFRRLTSDFNKGVPSSRLDGLVATLASDLLAGHSAPPLARQNLSSGCQSPEEKARVFLETRFTGAITLDALSKSVGLSPFHLQRRFLKSMGCTPKEYLLQHRIKLARQLLNQGLSLSQVALETGFYDQGHFTNRFKTVMGVTPGRFAQHNQAGH